MKVTLADLNLYRWDLHSSVLHHNSLLLGFPNRLAWQDKPGNTVMFMRLPHTVVGSKPYLNIRYIQNQQ